MTQPPALAQSSAAAAPSLRPMSSGAPALTREAGHAKRDLKRFAILLAQLAMLLLVAQVFRVESGNFFHVSLYIYVGFVIHYFTPLAWKKYMLAAIACVVGVMVIAQPDPTIAKGMNHYIGAAVVVGFTGFLACLFFLLFRLRASYRVRAGLALVLGAAVMYARTGTIVPDSYWPYIGSLLMFRMILFAYEVRIGKHPEKFEDFISYIFLPPNFHFLLFPVVDYSTFKKSWMADDIHRTAQRGVGWILRGTIQLCLYRYIYHAWVISANDVHSFATLIRYIFPAYLLYLRISGQFHVIVGMLHLFGYKLPETNKNYLLAESFTDFWRRINIYWKDFMVKVFYYPAYFRLRKTNEFLALTVATVWVFTATTVLHGYQWFWLQGVFKITATDLAFWCILGVLVWLTVLYEMKRGPRKPVIGPVGWIRRVTGTLGVYVTISLLWSMWSSGSVGGWFETVTDWR
jgi:hypothetical protein